ncbi:anti-sigma factor family protein [Embleya sp. NPDC050493]|uniref:anti-sigma factor family protein n=1 Tax=Embleya sp. NPDC050493 TaxID=3363989 RepID=UPI003791B3C7
MSEHIDVEVLSDLVEGLLDPEQATAVHAHLAECAECRDTRDALAEVRELLGAQPAEPMPADVVARIDDALALAALPPPRPAEAPSVGIPRTSVPAAAAPPAPTAAPHASDHGFDHGVVHLDAARRRRRRGPLLLAAAAVAAVALGVTVLVGTGGDDDGAHKPTAAKDNSAVSAPQGADRPAPSGKAGEQPGAKSEAQTPELPQRPSIAAPREYTAARLPEQVAQLLRRGTATPLVDLPGCVAAAIGPDAARPLATDDGRYAGKPVRVVVLDGPSADRVRVYIVDASCATQLSAAPSGPVTGSVLLSTVVPRG